MVHSKASLSLPSLTPDPHVERDVASLHHISCPPSLHSPPPPPPPWHSHPQVDPVLLQCMLHELTLNSSCASSCNVCPTSWHQVQAAQVREGLYYNPYFPGGAIAMPQMLADGGTEYEEEEVPATMSQQAKVHTQNFHQPSLVAGKDLFKICSSFLRSHCQCSSEIPERLAQCPLGGPAGCSTLMPANIEDAAPDSGRLQQRRKYIQRSHKGK